jgi:hypothetical protein
MSFNGAGTFTQATAPVVSGTVISSTNYNTQNTDFVNGLSNVICKDGQTTVTANLPMATYRHTGVGNAVARTDYAATGQVQDGSFTWCGTAGGTADALTLTPTPAITAYATGQKFRFKASANANTGAATVAVSGLTAKALQLNDTALAAGDIAANKYYEALYDGTAFQIQRISAAASSTIASTNVTFTTSDRILGRDTAGSGAGEELTLSAVLDFVGSAAQGDVLYRGAATWTRLGAGTSGQFLQTQGAGANPQWAAAGSATITLGTATSASGTSVDITGISASAKCIIITHAGLSTNGSSQYLVQIGDSGGIENTGYASQMADNGGSASSTAGFNLTRGADASTSLSGTVMINLVNSASNLWAASWVNGDGAASTTAARGGGQKTLSATLDRVRITTAGGTDSFDAGTINILVLA